MTKVRLQMSLQLQSSSLNINIWVFCHSRSLRDLIVDMYKRYVISRFFQHDNNIICVCVEIHFSI